MNKIKVLHVINRADFGGISACILNYYKYMNHDKFHFDFVMYDKKVGYHGKMLKEYGCNFFTVPSKTKKPIEYCKRIRSLLKEGKYDAIHVHTNTSSYIPLFLAKFSGVKIRVAHAHSAVINQSIVYRIKTILAHVFIPMCATHMCACSSDAGKVVFGKNARIIKVPNAIDVEKFIYNEMDRRLIREELNFKPETYVIGMVGRLSYEKNTQYTIKCFSKLLQEKGNEDIKLLIVGDGNLRNNLEALAQKLGVADDIVFLGQRSDIGRMYQAMDLFLLPSLFEGFPLSALEALTNGLPIILSSNITKDIAFGEKMTYLTIDDESISKWVETICEYMCERTRTSEKVVIENGYDIKECTYVLEEIYQGS